MTDLYEYETKPHLDIQITHFGYRQNQGKIDLVVGFRCFGPMTDNTKVEFLLSGDPGSPPNRKITDYWEPTLRNTQGFLQNGRFGSEPFKWPSEFEPIDGPYINGEHLDNLESECLFLVFCSIGWFVESLNLCGLVTPDE